MVCRDRVDILGPAVPTYTQHEVPWTADCVHSGDIHVVHEGQSGTGDGGKGASERVSRDIQSPGFALLLVEVFDCIVHATFAVPYRIHALIEALPPARFQEKKVTRYVYAVFPKMNKKTGTCGTGSKSCANVLPGTIFPRFRAYCLIQHLSPTRLPGKPKGKEWCRASSPHLSKHIMKAFWLLDGHLTEPPLLTVEVSCTRQRNKIWRYAQVASFENVLRYEVPLDTRLDVRRHCNRGYPAVLSLLVRSPRTIRPQTAYRCTCFTFDAQAQASSFSPGARRTLLPSSPKKPEPSWG